MVLGGAQAVRKETPQDLAGNSDFDEIVVADSNLEAAYDKNIGFPLSIGAQMIARAAIEGSRALLPESVINPDLFFVDPEIWGIRAIPKVA